MGRFLPLLMVVLLVGCSQVPGGAAPTGAANAARDALGNDEFGFMGAAG